MRPVIQALQKTQEEKKIKTFLPLLTCYTKTRKIFKKFVVSFMDARVYIFECYVSCSSVRASIQSPF